jgi:CubicO group peptidase (beta-lactamase class C family)
MLRHRLFSLALCMLLVAPCAIRADAVDDLIRSAMERQQIPGLALAVIRDGKLVKAKGYGFADIDQEVAVTAETVFPIASLSKPFLATAVMMLVEEGKLNLNAKISTYLKDTPEAWKDITVRHLLTHTSGIVRDDPLDRRALPTEEEMVKAVRDLNLAFPPGEGWTYSNVGYNLLSLIIAKAADKPWEKFLKERIFEPLQMTATRRIENGEMGANQAMGYFWRGDAWRKAPRFRRNFASGALLSTVTDLAKWDGALRGEKLLKKVSLEKMWTPVRLKDGLPPDMPNGGYGFGWHIGSVRGHRVIDHVGTRPGYTSYIGRFVEDGLTVVLLTNRERAILLPIALRVAGDYVPDLNGP